MSQIESNDSLFDKHIDQIADFAFDDKVAAVFPDMITRSVPGYKTIIAMTGLMAGRYATANSQCYDLGCSLGASTLAMSQEIAVENCRIVAVDSSKSMLDRCRGVLKTDSHDSEMEFTEADIRNITIKNASVVVLNFTLQFIEQAEREKVICNIYNGMNPGGIMILSEKICFEDPHLQQLNTDLHHNFKRANGYSDLEISQKRTAIENVLVPETIAAHQQRISRAGFSSCDVWFQCFNFASLVAVK